MICPHLKLFLPILLCLALPVAVLGLQPPRAEDRVLGDYDIRAAGPGPAPVPVSVATALDRLRGQSPVALQARFHPLTGGVRLLSSPQGVLTSPRGGPPLEIASNFLAANHEVFALSGLDLQSFVRGREYSSFNENITHLVLDQVSGGIRVFEADLRFHLNRAGQIVWISSSAIPNPAPAAGPQLSSAQAIQAAAADIRPELRFQPQLKSGPEGPDQASVFDRGSLLSDITARLVLFPTREATRLAWQLYLEPLGYPQAYSILVDAATGVVLYRRNIYQYADGIGNVAQSGATQSADARRPDEHPAGSNPSGASDPPNGCPPINNYLNRSLNSPFRDPATVLSNAGRLQGNNAHVFRGTTGVEGALGSLAGSVWQFNFTFNTADSAETHLFFGSNYVHDFFYDLGFDEAASNFQEDNFGRGGLGADSLNANARAPGRNNANFATPPDGQRPTMNMFLWDGKGCWSQNVDGDSSNDIDGDYDSDIVIHEFHHGVTHRLNTSFTGYEAGSAGEGGGDFFAYSINGDTRLADYSSPPSGIRGINSKTYGNWSCVLPPLFCSVHSNGEIWANTLWENRERFRVDQVNGSAQAGINELHRLYVDGLKLSPASPTMLELRDSMLQADSNRNAGANRCSMWEEFASRGMGESALDTKDTGNVGSVVQNFKVPDNCPPIAPSNLTATSASSSQINLAWTDNSTNEAGFYIERCSGSACADFTPLAQVAANVTSYSNTALAPGATFTYRVRAFNVGGNSGYSNTATATTQTGSVPNAPSNLRTTRIRRTSVDLAWNDNSNNENNFIVERCQGSGCTGFAQIVQRAANVTSYRNSGLTPNTVYRYRVKARNGLGDSGYSNVLEVRTNP